MKRVWKSCGIDYIYKQTGLVVLLTEQDILFGYKPEKINTWTVKFINHTILIIKMVVSKFRYGTSFDINAMFESEIYLRKHLLIPLS